MTKAHVTTEATYPGDSVLISMFTRGAELGDIRIQRYGDASFRVAMFLPGVPVCNPGDSPKTEPEQSEWFTTEPAARNVYNLYRTAALRMGWTERAKTEVDPDLAVAKESLRAALDWRGPTGRCMGHVAIARVEALALAQALGIDTIPEPPAGRERS